MDLIKKVRTFWILEAATDRRKTRYSEIYDQTPWKIPVKEFLSEATDNDSKILRKMNSCSNIFQGLQTADFT